MNKTIKILNQLETEGLFHYVIGGSIAAIQYVEPFLTEDCDVFIHVDAKDLAPLSPIYARLAELGYAPDGQYVFIEGVEIQFLPITTPLVQEAYDHPFETDIDGEPTRVFSPEYVVAICVETNRAKDWAKVATFIEEDAFDIDVLTEILERHSLWDRFVTKAPI